MNKNGVIYILVFLIVVSGIWGSLADRRRIAAEKKLKETAEQMEKMTAQSSKQREHVLAKTADLQETLSEKEENLEKARKELVTLRKEIKAIEAKLSGCEADVQKIMQEKEALLSKTQPPADNGQAKADGSDEANVDASSAQKPSDVKDKEEVAVDDTAKKEIQSLQEQLHTAEVTIDKLRQKFNSATAQMMGLEKLLEEKNAALEETSQDMDRLQINMDVLLSRIADQRDQLQEIQEENRDLVKELAAKNEEIADLQEEIMQLPVQE